MKQLFKVMLWVTAVLFFLTGCEHDYEEPTLVLQPYNGNELKLNGYYYDLYKETIWDIYFFYRNGVMLYDTGTDTLDNSLEKYDAWFGSDFFLNYIKTRNRSWGLYKIHGDKIVFERWTIAEGCDPIIRFSGDIINDTTFVITQSEYPHSNGVYQRNDTFRFRALSPKPDSTNVFIP